MTSDTDSPGTEFKVAIAGPVVTLAIAVACVASASRPPGPHEFWKAMRVIDDQADTSGVLAMLAWLAEHQPAGPGLQPDPRLPARRRPDRAGDRLAGDRRPQPGDALRGAASARASPTCSSRSGIADPARRRRDQRHLAGADRLHPRPVGARRRGPDRVREPDRGDQGRRRDGRRAGRDPRGRQRRAGARRVLPALPLALVPGGRRRRSASAACSSAAPPTPSPR